jgi:hypothetical protein
MKFDGEASYKNPAEGSGNQETAADANIALEPEASLVELAEQYSVDKVPITDTPASTEVPVSVDTSQDSIIKTEIATLEADIATITPDTNFNAALDVPAKVEGDILPETSIDQVVSEGEQTMTANELRNRYDGAFRHNAAKEAWEKRDQQQEIRAEKREMYSAEAETAEIEQARAKVDPFKKSSLELLDQQVADMKRQTEGALGILDNEIRNKKLDIARRNPLKKIIALGQKYVSFLGSDEIKSKIDAFETQKQELLVEEAQKNADLQSQIKQIKLEIQSQQEVEAGRIQARYSDGRLDSEAAFVASRKSLQERVRTQNQDSRSASEKTAELLAEGKLNVSELAKTTNSLVVHSLPLEGWNMNNTSMNNPEIKVDEVSVEEKISIVTEKQPDLSVSIVSIDNPDVKHGTMYPFGLIVDGSMIAAYDGDSSTIAKGDKRYRKYVGGSEGSTLQVDPAAAFEKNAQENSKGGYNEAIVHKPNIKGIFIDGERLKPVISTETGEPYDYFGDNLTEIFNEEEAAEVQKKYGDALAGGSIQTFSRFTPKTGVLAGQDIVRIIRKRSGEQKAIEFAKNNYPDLPIYIRRADGVYNIDGQPVSAEDVYAN